MASYNIEQKPGESIEQYYRRLAKTADQRLVRLERLQGQEGFGGVLDYAYQRAQRDIKQWSGENATRFNTKIPDNMNMVKAKINDMKTFLGSQTSTKIGIMKTYESRANTINEKYGTNVDWEDIHDYYAKNKNARADKAFGSKVAVKAIGVIQNWLGKGPDEDKYWKPEEEQKSLDELKHLAWQRKEDFTFTKDKIVNEAVKKILRSKSYMSDMYNLFN